jgi:probable O-glycosylation ligase (exosortase A-associated)
MFLVMISITTIFALAPWQQVFDKYALVFKVFLFLLVTAALPTSRERIHALVWVMALSLGYYGIKGGGFTLLGGGAERVFGPDSSMISDNNQLAVGLLVAMPLMNYLRLESRHWLIRQGFLAAMALTLLAVVGSYSRGALLARGTVCGYFWLKSSRKLLSGSLVAIALATAITFMPEKWAERMHSIETYQEDLSAQGRLQIWRVAWALATARPLIGGGFSATYSQPLVEQVVPGAEWRAVHSIWLEVLGEHGFPTFFVWLGISIAAAVYARRIIRQATGVPGLEWCINLARMAQVSMIAYISGGTFLSLCYWVYYFTILVIVAATHEQVRATAPQDAAAPRPAVACLPAGLALPR